MAAIVFEVTTRFVMSNFSVLECVYRYAYYPACRECDADVSIGEPTYFLDDKEIEKEKLPAGLEDVAERMYGAGKGSFDYKEERVFREPN